MKYVFKRLNKRGEAETNYIYKAKRESRKYKRSKHKIIELLHLNILQQRLGVKKITSQFFLFYFQLYFSLKLDSLFQDLTNKKFNFI